MKGVQASRGGPKISHLLFADDCILFGPVTFHGVNILKDALREYEHNFGQCVNFEKSTIFFSSNTIDAIKTQIVDNLRVHISKNSKKYLGLSNMVGRRKRASFQTLKDRLKKRINGWRMRFLSLGGKKLL